MSASTEKILRITLATLLLLVAINVLAGGYYGMAGAKDIPLQWLQTGANSENLFSKGIRGFFYANHW